MQYLTDFLNAKRLPIKEIMSQHCQISIKVDGSAFQTYCENNVIYFGKRYDKNSKPSSTTKQVNLFDFILHEGYFNAYTHLIMHDDIISKYKILNFEVLGDNHILDYSKNHYKNNIVLLSGFNYDDSELSFSELTDLANMLEVSCKEIIFSDYLQEGLIDLLIAHKDNAEWIWNFLTTHLFNIDNYESIEGVVFEFGDNNRVLKLPEPMFQKKLQARLDNGATDKTQNFENCFDFVIDNIDTDLINNDLEYFNKLVECYRVLEETKNCKSIELCLEKNVILQCQSINNVLLKTIYNGEIKYTNLMKFILLGFRNKRHKQPLWCSQEYQESKLNKFIDKLD